MLHSMNSSVPTSVPMWIVPVITVMLNADNWYAFNHSTFGNMKTISGLDRYVQDNEAFKLFHQKYSSEFDITSYELNNQLSMEKSNLKDREAKSAGYILNYKVSAWDVAKLNQLGRQDEAYHHLMGPDSRKWTSMWLKIKAGSMDIDTDIDDQPDGVSMLDILESKEYISRTIIRITNLKHQLEKINEEKEERKSSVNNMKSRLDHESRAFINQLFCRGNGALIDPNYLTELEGGEAWEDIQYCRTTCNIIELWKILRSLQEADYPLQTIDLSNKLIHLLPTPNEDLYAFDARYEAIYRAIHSKVEIDGRREDDECIPERILIRSYMDILKEYYLSPTMSKFLEPYYFKQTSDRYTSLPKSIFIFRENLRSTLKAARNVSNIPIKMAASRAVVSSAVSDQVISANDSTIPNPSPPTFLKCWFCQGRHETNLCRTISRENQDSLRKVVSKAKSDLEASRAMTPRNKSPVAERGAWLRNRGNKNVHFKEINALEAPTSTTEQNDNILDWHVNTIVIKVIGAFIVGKRFFQLDGGSNTHYLNLLALFIGSLMESDCTFQGACDDAPKKLGMIGETMAFGTAFYNPNARNIISVSQLEEADFDLTPVKDPVKITRTTAWIVSKHGHEIVFNLINGNYYASEEEVMTFARKFSTPDNVVAIATRGNPLGIPNDTSYSNVHEEMDIEEDIEEVLAPDIVMNVDPNIVMDVEPNIVIAQPPVLVVDSPPAQVPEASEVLLINPNLPQSSPDGQLPSAEPATLRNPAYVPSLRRFLTIQEQKRQVLAGKLHVASGHAGKATEKLLLEGGHLANTTLFPKDIDIYHEISGTCLGCVKGKMTMPPSTPWTIRTGALIGEYWECDNAYFGGKTHLVLVEVVSNYAVVYKIDSRHTSSITNAAIQWKNLLHKSFPQLFIRNADGSLPTIKMKCDREPAFNAFAAAIDPLVLEKTSAEGHASRVEVLNRIIKERARAIMYGLPYKLPSALFDLLIQFVVDIKNYLPSTVTSNQTAMGMVFSKKIAEPHLLQLQFGYMVATIKPLNQRGPKTDALATFGIVVGFEVHTPHNVKVFNIETRSIVVRSKIVPIYSPELIIALNLMSRDDMMVDPFPLTVEAPVKEPLMLASVEGGLPTSFTTIPSDFATLDNMTLRKAIIKFGYDHVLQSTLAELDNMERMQVFSFLDPKLLDPKDFVLQSLIFYKAKVKDGVFDKLKARCVCRGDGQLAESYGETKSPTADKASLFMICALNKFIKGNIYSVDIPAAFLFAKLKENLNMRLPKDITPLVIKERPELRKMLDKHGRLTVKLLKSIYGLKQSPLNWFHHLVAILEDAGFVGCITDRCVFFRNDKQGITHLLFHVDDLFVSSNAEPHMIKLREALAGAFGKMEWAERKFTFLGMHFNQRDDFSIDVDMVAYTMEFLKQYWTTEIGAEFHKTRGIINPSTDNLFHEIDIDPNATPKQISEYKSISMGLMWMGNVRIDILKECVVAASQSHAPGPRSWKLLRQIIAYLKENPAFVINFGADSTELTMYADAGYAQHPDASSHTGIFVTLGTNGGGIIVKSKKQGLVTQSSTEAELLGLCDGVKRAIALAKLLVELRLNNTLFILAVQDNTSTISIALAGEGMHGKAKHFLVRFHFLRQLLDQGTLEIIHGDTEDMIPDYLTKGMTGIKFQMQAVRGMYHGDIEAFKNACREAFARVTGKM